MMRKRDGVRIALASLLEHKLRTFLTFLGVAISVTAVILVVSVIQGLDLYVQESVSDLGPDVFLVNQFGIITNRKDFLDAVRRNPRIRMDDVVALRRQAFLAERVGVSRTGSVSVRYGNKTIANVNYEAMSAEVQEISPIEAVAGRRFSREEAERGAMICFIGHDVAEELFAPLDPVNRSIRMWGRSFRVVGVAEKRGSSFGRSQDNFIHLPISVYQKMRGLRDGLSISVQAASVERVEAAKDEVRGIMRARHHLKYDEDDDFGIITSAGIISFIDGITRNIFGIAVFIVSISLVVGGIVIMNIMLLTVVERTREIGIRKAIGAQQSDIRFQFMVESVVLCSLGGFLGAAAAWALVWIIGTFSPLPAVFPLWAPLLAISVTSTIGIFFGIYPARQAARLNPIEALRSQTS